MSRHGKRTAKRVCMKTLDYKPAQETLSCKLQLPGSTTAEGVVDSLASLATCHGPGCLFLR
jgi:hypothetical protein